MVLGHAPAIVLHHLVHAADRVWHFDFVERFDELFQIRVPLLSCLQPRRRRIARETLAHGSSDGVHRPGGRAPEFGHGSEKSEPLFEITSGFFKREVFLRRRSAARESPLLPVVRRVLECHIFVSRLVHVVAGAGAAKARNYWYMP